MPQLLLTLVLFCRHHAIGTMMNNQYHYEVTESPDKCLNGIYWSVDIAHSNHDWTSHLVHTANPNCTLKSVYKHERGKHFLIISHGPPPVQIMYWEIVALSPKKSYQFGHMYPRLDVIYTDGDSLCLVRRCRRISTVNKRRVQSTLPNNQTHNLTQPTLNNHTMNTQTQLNISDLITMLHERDRALIALQNTVQVIMIVIGVVIIAVVLVLTMCYYHSRDRALIALQNTVQVIMIVIGVVIIAVVLVLTMCYYHSRDLTNSRVPQVHGCENNNYNDEDNEGSGNVKTDREQSEHVQDMTRISKEGIATVVGHWEPERFHDMLVNSDGVQKAIMDDIIVGMKTEEGEQIEITIT
eukprot:580597_1